MKHEAIDDTTHSKDASDDGAETSKEVSKALLLLRHMDFDGGEIIEEENARQLMLIGARLFLEVLGDGVLVRPNGNLVQCKVGRGHHLRSIMVPTMLHRGRPL